jgi:hypothetical protein
VFEEVCTLPRLTQAIPRYRCHKASGQAVVTIAGRDHYLGPWRSKASKVEYLVNGWLGDDERIPNPLG